MSVGIEDIRALIRECNIVDDVDALRPDVSLTIQGLDSLDHFNIFLLVEERFHVKISDDDIPTLDTVEALARFVRAHQKPGPVTEPQA